MCSTRAALVVLASAFATHMDAQDLARRVTASAGTVNVIYPSRPNVCGDGRSFIQHVTNDNRYYSGTASWTSRDDMRMTQCVHGPARVAATVIDGEVTRLRLYVGPVPTTPDGQTISASAADAAEWLGALVSRGAPRVASEAMMPLIVADASNPWPLLLKVARDENRPRDVRRSTLMWLSNAVNDHLGIAGADEHASDDDEMRSQAVFVLSQRPKAESVPELIDLARTSRHPAARKAAIFWLGQSGDMRAADVYAELLGIR
jgi:hypothetical protein